MQLTFIKIRLLFRSQFYDNKVHDKDANAEKPLGITSLKIFKHYKLKPSFSMIKDGKAKDKVWVGDKPPPQSFNNLIKFDPI